MMIARMNESGYALASVLACSPDFLAGRAAAAMYMVSAPANSPYFVNLAAPLLAISRGNVC